MYKVLLYGMFGGLYGHWCGVGVACKDNGKGVMVVLVYQVVRGVDRFKGCR